MENYYTDEVNAQLVLAGLKKMGVKKVVASAGTTNIPILQSIQYDSYFEVYSSVDERSAAYLACGLSLESGEPVALSCTGATASRNYLSGLTEAFYKKLPIVAITSTNGNNKIGNLIPQNIDRTSIPNDVASISVQLPIVKDANDYWYCKYLVNKAFLELKKNGSGPIHINLPTSYKGTFSTKNLPKIEFADIITEKQKFPKIPENYRIAIFIGSHKKFQASESLAIENFCKKYSSVVLCDHTSNYNGYGKVTSAIACLNANKEKSIYNSLIPDLIIHIGEVSGDYATSDFLGNCEAKVWRVSNDGELKDTFKKIEYIFHCEEQDFFNQMVKEAKSIQESLTYLEKWQEYVKLLRNDIEGLPFSNISIAQALSQRLPKDSNIHFGILNSLRSNNFFEYDSSVSTNSNVGGFGIDGCLSTIVGSSLASPKKMNFIVLGDLAFFYDMNVLGNKHIRENLRIILINNGGGGEFKNYSHIGSRFGDKADEFIAAADHFGIINGKSSPAKCWVESFGMDYISATDRNEFNQKLPLFLGDSEKIIVFECFTKFQDDSEALRKISNLDNNLLLSAKLKNNIKKRLSSDVKNRLKVIGKK
ncbi:thiamine pyrophosphate-binding protein [Enterococcus malodoratus]|uniref:thiamine pyrophosphate-binding protein n=1 Tax=Enterococcus malodoratus TaxID=71451 RepID=UPI0022E658FF|nr:thiamine pyrophosphate-binding protein [Enterococcus malodoratus]